MKYLNLLVLFFAFVIINSCSDDNTTNPSGDGLKVAAIIDLSAHYSQFGIEAKQAMDLALKDARNIQIEYYDSKADLATSDKLLDSIIKKGDTKVVVTLASWISNGLAQKINNNNMLQIAIGSAVFDYASLNSCVRLTGDVSSESKYLSEELKKYNKIGVLYFNNDYGKGWFNTLSSVLGNKIIAAESYTDTQTDFTTPLNKVNAKNPDVIVLISTREAVDIIRQARNLGINAQFIGTRPTLTNQLLAEPLAEGMMFSYPDLDESISFYQLFKSTYSYRMSAFGAEGYDLVKTLDQAYQNNNKDRNVLFTNYRNKSVNGALGKIKFDANAQADYDFTLMVIKNRTWEEVK